MRISTSILHRSYKSILLTSLILVSVLVIFAQSQSRADQSIIVLVNDEPISAFDVEQRIKFTMVRSGRKLGGKIKKKLGSKKTQERYRRFMVSNNPQSRDQVEKLKNQFIQKLRSEVITEMKPQFYDAALEQLIEEKLILQEAKKVSAPVSDKDVTDAIGRVAARNKDAKTGQPLSVEKFLGNLRRSGISPKTYKASLKANIAMRNIIRKRYGLRMQSMVSAQDIDQAMSGLGDDANTTEFRLQKVSLSLSDQKDQKALAQKLVDAEQMRGQFTSCEQTEALAKSVGAQVVSLGKRTIQQMPKASRMVLKEAKTGEMTPPDITEAGIQLYAVCDKRIVKGDSKKREQVEQELKSKEIDILKKRYLRDLRQDAFIEYRNKSRS